MTRQDRQVLGRMMQRTNAFEASRGRSYADAPAAVNPAATQLAAAQGNPGFAAQFDVQFLTKFWSIVTATGVATSKTAAQILVSDPTLATQLAVFLFGNSDFAAGFARAQQAYPLSGGWTYGIPFIYGKTPPFLNLTALIADATVQAQLRRGDLVIPAFFVNGANTIVATTIVRCNQVGYGTLLDALNSDRFIINMVRYIMSDTTAVGLAQYNNQIGIYKQSLFGKFDSDFISPTSFKMPEQMQDGIIDIPIEKGIDKQIIVGTYQNYDAVSIQWSVFVSTVDKLAF